MIQIADQEFLASFGVEIDESGLDRLQKALIHNRELAEELAAAFDSAREAIGDFFRQLSSSTLPTGELSPYQRLMELSEEGISFALDLDVSGAEETLDGFLLQARELSAASQLPLSADPSGLNQTAEEALRRLRELFGSTLLPLLADASGVIAAGQEALSELQSIYSSPGSASPCRRTGFPPVPLLLLPLRPLRAPPRLPGCRPPPAAGSPAPPRRRSPRTGIRNM